MTTLYPQFGIFYVSDPAILQPKLDTIDVQNGQFTRLNVDNIYGNLTSGNLTVTDGSIVVPASTDQLILSFANGIIINGNIINSDQIKAISVEPTVTTNNGFQTLTTITLPVNSTYMINAYIVATGIGISGVFEIKVWCQLVAGLATIYQTFDTYKLASGVALDMQYIASSNTILLQQDSLGNTITWNGYITIIGVQS